MVPLAVGNAAAVRVGNNVGAKELIAAKYSAYFALRLAVICAIIASILIVTYAEFLASLLNQNPEVISLAVTLLFFAAFFQIADGLAMGGIGALRGYKDTFGPMKIMAISYWGIGLPVGIVLSTTSLVVDPMEAVGMWIGICLGLLVAATLMVLRVKETSNRFIDEQHN